MTATVTSKGQITIPLSLRTRLNLKAGDQLEFDENATVLTARRVVHRSDWENVLKDWQASASTALQGHPWENQPSTRIIDDLRGGPSEIEVAPP
jgi:AbrB family looped-hinge helix DNA binding protein